MQNIDPDAVFAALSNPVRLRALLLVARHADVCVCEVESALSIAQPAASKALNALKAAGYLDSRRDANWTYYSLSGAMPDWVRAIVDNAASALGNTEPYLSDSKRFADLELRPGCG